MINQIPRFNSRLQQGTYNTAGLPTANIRVLHAVPDAPCVDVYANGALIARNLCYKDFSEYIAVPSGYYNIAIYATGDTSTPVLTEQVLLAPGTISTAAATGKLENIKLTKVEDTRLPMNPERAQLRVVNLSPNSPAVDVALRSGDLLFKNIGFNVASPYLSLPPNTYNFEIFRGSTPGKILSVPNINIKPNRFLSMYLVGLLEDNPELEVLIPMDGNTYL